MKFHCISRVVYWIRHFGSRGQISVMSHLTTVCFVDCRTCAMRAKLIQLIHKCQKKKPFCKFERSTNSWCNNSYQHNLQKLINTNRYKNTSFKNRTAIKCRLNFFLYGCQRTPRVPTITTRRAQQAYQPSAVPDNEQISFSKRAHARRSYTFDSQNCNQLRNAKSRIDLHTN